LTFAIQTWLGARCLDKVEAVGAALLQRHVGRNDILCRRVLELAQIRDVYVVQDRAVARKVRQISGDQGHRLLHAANSTEAVRHWSLAGHVLVRKVALGTRVAGVASTTGPFSNELTYPKYTIVNLYKHTKPFYPCMFELAWPTGHWRTQHRCPSPRSCRG